MDIIIPPEVVPHLPPTVLIYITILLNAAMFLGRAYNAIRNSGGLKGIWNSVMFGSVTITSQTQEPKQPTMKNTLTLLSIIGLAAAVLFSSTGCADLSTKTFRMEQLAVNTAYSGVRVFNQYYHSATNGASVEALKELNEARDKVYDASRKFAASASLAERMRLQYEANQNETNKLDLVLAMDVLEKNAENIKVLVEFFATKPVVPNKPPVPMPVN